MGQEPNTTIGHFDQNFQSFLTSKPNKEILKELKKRFKKRSSKEPPRTRIELGHLNSFKELRKRMI